MSNIESFEIEPDEQTWAVRRQGRGLVAPERRTACRCGRCRVYRWYPPLLVVSTVMTAVFCFLYLTKPVFLQSPVMKVKDESENVPRGYMIAGADRPGEGESAGVPVSTMPRELDPGRLSFPMEDREVDPVVAALRQPEPIDLLDVPAATPPPEKADPAVAPPVLEPVVIPRREPMPVRVSVGGSSESMAPALPGGFEPLRIEKADKPMFQSLTQEDLAHIDAQRRAKEAPALNPGEESEPADSEEAGGDPVLAALISSETDAEADDVEVEIAVDEKPKDGGGEEPVMRASFIGEFYPDEEEKSEAGEMLNKT